MNPRAWSALAILLAAGAPTLVVANGAIAQQPPADAPAEPTGPARWEIGADLLLADPVGEFGRYVDGSAGFGVSGVRYFGTARRFGVRADLSLVSYGSVTTSSEVVLGGIAVDVDVTTQNAIASFSVGPQYVFGRGRFRPWVSASIGSAQFVTTTTAWSGGRPVPLATADVLENNTLALTAGGGARVALWPGRRRPIALEIDARYHRHGRVEYLREGGVRDLPDGSVALDPITSDGNLWTIRFGVVMGFR